MDGLTTDIRKGVRKPYFCFGHVVNAFYRIYAISRKCFYFLLYVSREQRRFRLGSAWLRPGSASAKLRLRCA